MIRLLRHVNELSLNRRERLPKWYPLMRSCMRRQGARPSLVDSAQTLIPCGLASGGAATRGHGASAAWRSAPGIYLRRLTQVVGCQQQGAEPSVTRPRNQGEDTVSIRGTAARNPRVNAACGRCNTVAAGPDSSMRPRFITTTWSARQPTTPMLPDDASGADSPRGSSCSARSVDQATFMKAAL